MTNQDKHIKKIAALSNFLNNTDFGYQLGSVGKYTVPTGLAATLLGSYLNWSNAKDTEVEGETEDERRRRLWRAAINPAVLGTLATGASTLGLGALNTTDKPLSKDSAHGFKDLFLAGLKGTYDKDISPTESKKTQKQYSKNPKGLLYEEPKDYGFWEYPIDFIKGTHNTVVDAPWTAVLPASFMAGTLKGGVRNAFHASKVAPNGGLGAGAFSAVGKALGNVFRPFTSSAAAGYDSALEKADLLWNKALYRIRKDPKAKQELIQNIRKIRADRVKRLAKSVKLKPLWQSFGKRGLGGLLVGGAAVGAAKGADWLASLFD